MHNCFGLVLLLSIFSNVLSITRHYYIAAVEQDWDYCPSGIDFYTGLPAEVGEPGVFIKRGPARVGSIYKKALFKEYTDDTFTELKPQPSHLGLVGPTIRAEVGDTIEVTFFNNATLPYTLHPHGVAYLAESEGIPNVHLLNDGVVKPSQKFVYEWSVPARSGPTKSDGNAVMWMYHSHVNEVFDVYSGLFGALVVYGPNTLSEETGLPTDVDNEFVLVFQVMNENLSHYLNDSCAAAHADCDSDDGEFEESNLMHSINGYNYANLPGLDMEVNSIVRWLVAGLGTEVDLHTAHWHGNTLTYHDHVTDVAELLPASFHVLDMQPDMEGTWRLHCHVNDHIVAGMTANYTVHPAGSL